MDVPGRIETIQQLSEHFHPPNERVSKKQLDRLNAPMAAFIDHVSFLVIATSDGAGSVDASPRGGPPGFVRRLDERHIAIPDLTGNNRIDSYRNIMQFPYVGLLMMVPGLDETLRINGPAAVTDDPDLLSGFMKELRVPHVALVVETAEVFGHCAKAFKRGKVWQPSAWTGVNVAPDLAAIYSCEFGLDEEATRLALSKSYAEGLSSDLP